ncbi:MAG: SoxY-related AACIE arm protein [Ectothiorhodospiraceae bacterium]|nr:SoxY-related AACIE arm protein [Ectothiorhodospiraceae bacterium]
MRPGRRHFLRITGAIATAAMVGGPVEAQRRRGTMRELEAAVRATVGEGPIVEGRVTVEIPALVENGNAVPLTVRVESPMSADDHVRAIHVFSEKNPRPSIVSFHLGPRAGRAEISTRIRLVDTQTVVAVAETSDGRRWSGRTDVVVTLAACLEDA